MIDHLFPVLSELGLVTQGDTRCWAVTSPDDRYRYLLGRAWDDKSSFSTEASPLWCFVMLNPSRARHDVDDHTIRKCTGFARAHGARGFIVVNLMAFSETYPGRVVQAHRDGVDVVGAHNAAAVDWAIKRVHTSRGCVVAAWGRVPPKLIPLVQDSLSIFRSRLAFCLGTNRDGSPRHPLTLPYSSPLLSWPP